MQKAKNKKRLIIIGARLDGHAGVILDTIKSLNKYDVVGFIDNTPELQNKKIDGIPVIGSTDNLDLFKIPAQYAHIAIGDNLVRGNLFNALKKKGLCIETIIHPTATISKNTHINEGCFVGARAVINNGVTVGPVTIINTGAIVEHDNKIGFAVHVAPGVKTAGRVVINDFAFIGIGATILPDIHIGQAAMVGAGATVVKNVSSKTTVIGYAAKKHKKNIYVDVKSDVAVNDEIFVAQPTLPDYQLIDVKFRDIANTLRLSNFGKFSRELEAEVESSLLVKKALSFPNDTSALMLVLKALNLSGEVILPSFTFSAMGHAVVWNGLTPVFADIDLKTFNIDPEDVKRKITPETSAILAVHIFGNPAPIDELSNIAKKHELKLIFDSAHALGAQYKGKFIGGFGDVECFSLSGTKVITSAEGGIVTSNNEEFMKRLDLGRNYGAGRDYDCQYIGLNGKMSEFHAAIALEGIPYLEEFVNKRNKLASLYRDRLGEIKGISFQHIPKYCVSTYKDFAVVIDKKAFGMDRDELAYYLEKDKIFPKKYFSPPLHRMKAYSEIKHRAERLKNTEFLSSNILCLPIFSHMSVDTLEKICYAISRICKSRNGK